MGRSTQTVDRRDDGTVILSINCEECDFFPSVENEPRAMKLALQTMIEKGPPTTLIFQQLTDYEYPADQTALLANFATTIDRIQKVFRAQNLAGEVDKGFFMPRQGKIGELINEELLSDPMSAYIQLQRLKSRDLEARSANELKVGPQSLDKYFRFLDSVLDNLDKTLLIKKLKPSPRHKIGDRTPYAKEFKAITRPDFMRSKLQSQYPLDGEILDSYSVLDPLLNRTIAEVTIFKLPNSERNLYHVIPIEANLTWEKYALLHEAKQTYENRPSEDLEKNTASYLENPRGYLFNLARGLIFDLARVGQKNLSEKDVDELASILVRNMIGFGILEVLLTDRKVQDIVVNSPSGKQPLHIKMRGFDECYTNIYPTKREVESWATRLRFLSGRPLDEAHPILDTDKLEIPGNFRSRTAIITSPLNAVQGDYAFAIRQHSPDPVTFARYSQTKEGFRKAAKKNPKWASTAWGAMMLAPSKQLGGLPFAAGLLNFIVDGKRTLLVAGTRSSGKTTLLSSLISNISRRARVITIEDTLEIPVEQLKSLGFNIQSLKVRSALGSGTTEVSAEDGIRSTLRMGDSALIVGEVRSTEALALYEAMRVGALANVVAGTIHANDAYGVFDRVCNDLKVPATSFKATDIILMARPLPYLGKRLTSITEVRKFWTEDPLKERGFVDLVKFDYENDSLEPTDHLKNGDSDILKEIGSRVDAFAGNWSAIWENILLRARVIQHLINKAYEIDEPELVRAAWYIKVMDAFRDISNDVYEEIRGKTGVGAFPSDEIFRQWSHWLDKAVERDI
jgi:archaeal flagellar protein FlaI